MLSRYQSAPRKLFVYGLLHTQFPLFSNTLLCPRNFCELVILYFMLSCPNNLVHCYRNVRETQWTPNKPKARRIDWLYHTTARYLDTGIIDARIVRCLREAKDLYLPTLTPAGWKLRSHARSRLRTNFSRLIEKCELLPSCLTQFPKIC